MGDYDDVSKARKKLLKKRKRRLVIIIILTVLHGLLAYFILRIALTSKIDLVSAVVYFLIGVWFGFCFLAGIMFSIFGYFDTKCLPY